MNLDDISICPYPLKDFFINRIFHELFEVGLTVWKNFTLLDRVTESIHIKISLLRYNEEGYVMISDYLLHQSSDIGSHIFEDKHNSVSVL